MHQSFRRERQHDHRGDGQRTKRDGTAVDDDGDQDHRSHEERALRRDFGARQQQIKRGSNECRSRRPFLDRKCQVDRTNDITD